MQLNNITHKYCINLDRRPDRWEKVQKEFEKHGITGVERIAGVDSKDIDPGQLPAGVNRGDIGCAKSHYKVVCEAIANNAPYYIVFEDDFEGHPQINELFEQHWPQVPEDWDIVYLGANHNAGYLNVSENIVKCIASYTTHCMIVRNTVYHRLIQIWENPLYQVDVLLAMLHKEINAYCFRPNIAYQADGFSDILNREVKYEHLRK